MTTNRPNDVLSPSEAQRVLERASEFDALRRAGTAVSDLRSAASEAGISDAAFDAALSERAAAAAPRSRWQIVAGIVALGLGAWLVLSLLFASPTVSATMSDDAVLLRCLPVKEAAELVRPILDQPGNSVIIAPDHAPRVITIHGTREQLRQARALLERYDAAESSCPAN